MYYWFLFFLCFWLLFLVMLFLLFILNLVVVDDGDVLWFCSICVFFDVCVL